MSHSHPQVWGGTFGRGGSPPRSGPAGMIDLNLVKRVDRVLGCLSWDLHTHAQDHIAPADLFGPEGMAHLRLLDEKAGHKSGDERKRWLRETCFDHERGKSESLSECAARWGSQFRKAAARGLLLPDTAKGLFLIGGAKLTEQGAQSLQTSRRGRKVRGRHSGVAKAGHLCGAADDTRGPGTMFLERRPHSEHLLGRVPREGRPRPHRGRRQRRRGGQRPRRIVPPTRGDAFGRKDESQVVAGIPATQPGHEYQSGLPRRHDGGGKLFVDCNTSSSAGAKTNSKRLPDDDDVVCGRGC